MGPHSPNALPPFDAFLIRYWRDADAGGPRPLSDYLLEFRGAEIEIAREYLRLTAPAESQVDFAGDGISPTLLQAPVIEVGGQLGSYRLHEEIGAGGQGRVFAATDIRLGRRVALKLLRAGWGEAGLLRFQREAEITSRLEDPRICTVYEAGAIAGIPFIAMRLLDGETLSRRIRSAKQKSADGDARTWIVATEGPIPEGADEGAEARLGSRADLVKTAGIFEEIAEALHAAHEKAIIHRDIKPGNLMITAAGCPVILDFGLARDTSSETPTLTEVGEVFGTPEYMSHEQLLAGRMPIDRRTDVYSLGVSLFEAVTLQRPFSGATRDLLVKAIATKTPPDASRINPLVPRDLDVIIATCLAKDPDRRYLTARDLAEDLAHFRKREPIRARPPSWPVRWYLWSRRQPALAATLALSFILVGVVPTVFWLRERDHGHSLERERDVVEERRKEVQDFADVMESESLIREEAALYPLIPEKVAAMVEWIDRVDALLQRFDQHGPLGPDSPVKDWSSHAVRTGHLRELRGQRQEKIAAARDLERRSFVEFADSWRTAIDSIHGSALYGHLELAPQRGLVPFRENSATHLWEFWVLLSGEIPRLGEGPMGESQPEWPILLVLVPGGEYEMGSGGTGPVIRRTVRPWFMGAFEVTQAQYLRVIGENPSSATPRAESDKQSWTNPVEMVTWFDAWNFADRLELELPSEVQWEYASRPKNATRYWWGDSGEDVDSYENIADMAYFQAKRVESPVSWDDGFAGHAPVGSFMPNQYGLYDMVGNVGEWCATVSRRDRIELPETPEHLGSGGRRQRVIWRGSNYNSADLRNCVPAAFANERPEVPTPATGFRVARRICER